VVVLVQVTGLNHMAKWQNLVTHKRNGIAIDSRLLASFTSFN